MKVEERVATLRLVVDQLEKTLWRTQVVVGVLALTQIVSVAVLVAMGMKLMGVSVNIETASTPALSDAPGPSLAEAQPAPVPVSLPEPDPQPRPVTPPPPGGLQAMVEQGWAHVSSGSTSAAARSFRAALDRDPSHALANYGYGYVLIEQGSPSQAERHLCTARRLGRGDVELYREVEALLTRHGLQCR